MTNSQDRVERLRGSAASPMRKPGLWILYSATLLKPGNFRHPSCEGSCIVVFLNIPVVPHKAVAEVSE